ncbi:MAG: hypothetical protein AAF497_13010 [Planctomycetota bacterium]
MSISELEYGGKRRYQVRVMRNGRSHSKVFTSKREARRFEKQLIEKLGPPRSQVGVPKKTTPPNTGIKRIVRRTFCREGRKPVEVFTVYFRTPEGAPRYSNVSIEYWGEKKALRLAKQKKKEMDAKQLGKKKTAKQ